MKVWALAALVACLAACAARPIRSELPPARREAAEAALAMREAALRDAPAWALSGRIAVSTGRNGGSGRIEWRQAGGRYDVSVSAPVTRQSWRLSGDAAGATLQGLEGGPRQGPDAAALLFEATGWDIPVVALADWIRGARSDALGPAVVSFDADGRLSRIGQGGWTIDYVWPEAGTAPAAGVVLPARLDARRGEARVKLVVDQWGGSEGG